MRPYDFTKRQFVSSEARAEAYARMSSHVLPDAVGRDYFADVVRSGNAQNIVRVGDIEALFLCLPFVESSEERELILSNLWFCGIDSDNMPDPAEFADLLRQAEILMVQPPFEQEESFWGHTEEAFRHWELFDERRPLLDVHLLYYSLHDGALFQPLRGKKVALVGAKSQIFFRYFYLDEDYRRTFSFLNLDEIDICRVIPTPDVPQFCMNHIDDIREELRQSYSEQIDVYLFSCGILAKYLSVMVQQEAGRWGWDLGAGLDILMGLQSERQWLCGPFKDYQHPRYEFLRGPNATVAAIIPRGAPLTSENR